MSTVNSKVKNIEWSWGRLATREFYPDVADELSSLDQRVETMRSLWRSGWLDEQGRADIAEQAESLKEERLRKQFRLNRHEDEVIQEKWSLDNTVDYDSTLPKTDAEWLSWKVNKFIRNISHRTSAGGLYVGRVRIRPVTKDGWFEFRCYAKGCSFHARHYVGTDQTFTSKRVELRLGRILAHYYKH